MSVIYSFFQLISKCRIEIPIIQRDYAQGRVNSKAKDVRKAIVSDLIKAVKGEKALFFDFVYGRLDSYKFIPFDGQQRLTSIYTSLFSSDPVNTRTEKGQPIKRYYYIDMEKAIDISEILIADIRIAVFATRF